ncbi:MAG TPA: helix-turn-helix domain-containing protein [Streptosporangiaceae bacterium]
MSLEDEIAGRPPGEPGRAGEAGQPGEPGRAGDAGRAGEPGEAGQPAEAGDAGEPGEAGRGGGAGRAAEISGLRAWAHPLRLRILSLVTGTAMSAAELARELGVSQALASYHLRQLADANVVELAEERTHRGGRERRYRYRVPTPTARWLPAADQASHALFVEALAAELRRRSAHRAQGTKGLAVDAELWVSPGDWEEAERKISEAAIMLHERARRPHEAGTIRTSATLVMFRMVAGQAAGPGQEVAGGDVAEGEVAREETAGGETAGEETAGGDVAGGDVAGGKTGP